MLSSKYVIQLDNVCVTLGEKLILNNLNIEIKQGTLVGIIGPNGAGKTTLLKLILGLIRQQAGKVTLFGFPVDKLNKKKYRIGYLPQKHNFDRRSPVSVLDVVIMGMTPGLGLLRFPGRKEKNLALACLEKVGMLDYHKRQIGELSGGQQQLVFLARALCSNPKLLMLDEPTTGLDIKVQQKFYALVNEIISQSNITVLSVSHDLQAISNYAHDLISLDESWSNLADINWTRNQELSS